jgi:hypothetical protein
MTKHKIFISIIVILILMLLVSLLASNSSKINTDAIPPTTETTSPIENLTLSEKHETPESFVEQDNNNQEPETETPSNNTIEETTSPDNDSTELPTETAISTETNLTPSQQKIVNAGYGVVIELDADYYAVLTHGDGYVNGKKGGEILRDYLAEKGWVPQNVSGGWIDPDNDWYCWVAKNITKGD